MKSNKWKILHKHKRQCVWMGPQGRGTRPAGITSLICEFAGMDSVVRLHGGLPPDAAFPIAGATFQLADGGSICVDDPSLASPCLSILTHTFPHLTRTLQHCFRYRRITTGARKPTSNVHGIAWSKSHETAACVITITSCIRFVLLQFSLPLGSQEARSAAGSNVRRTSAEWLKAWNVRKGSRAGLPPIKGMWRQIVSREAYIRS